MIIKKLIRTVSVTTLTVSLALTGTVASALTMSACKNENTDTTEVVESVELIDPVGSTENYAVAERRDLRTYTLLNGKVVPHVYEYSFSSSQNFDSYVNLPGMEVKKGDALINASTKKLDDQAKALKEEMSSFMETYNDDMDEYRENLAKAKANEEYWKDVTDRLDAMTPDQLDQYNKGVQREVYSANVPVEKAQDVIAKYNNDLNEFLNDNGPLTIGSEWDSDGCALKYIAAVADRERIEQTIKERSENYDLDLAHYKTRLNRIAKKKSDVVVSSKVDGKVVSIGFFDNNQWIEKNRPIAAVGDFDDLEIKTEYVVATDIKRAVDVFGFCNGKRYEVEFVEPEPNETVSSMADARSTFRVNDPNGEVKAGDYLVVVVVNKLSQLSDALTCRLDIYAAEKIHIN